MARSAESIAERLWAAELELVDLRAIRDALVEPALVQREGMTIAAEVISAGPHVGGDFFFVGDGANGTTVMAIGDVVGKGLSAARSSTSPPSRLSASADFYGSNAPAEKKRFARVGALACRSSHPHH